jgi:anthraniloyl-CoA monooxygenase
VKIVCVGGGPAGLYFAISLKRRDPAHEITVIERDPLGATYGWGVVYWDNLLDMLYSNDMESARKITAMSRLWQEQEIRLGSDSAYLPGYGYSIQRSALLDVLVHRAAALGIDVRHNQQSTAPPSPAWYDADLVVGADGANSAVRAAHGDSFGTTTVTGSNRYIWLGTTKVFDRFTFAFQHTRSGWLWFHAYPSSDVVSTCIVECTDATWHALGFDRRGHDDSARLLETIFHSPLDGAPLISSSREQPAQWTRFTEVINKTWRHDNTVLLGDAAHTTHFTIGSGTRLAMIDAVSLAQSIYEHPGATTDALRVFEQRRRGPLEETQASARASQSWFEHIDHYVGQDAGDFAYSMSSRQGQQPPWRYQKHLLAQCALSRRTRRHYDTVRRWYSASRRGETPFVPPSAFTTARKGRPAYSPIPAPVSTTPVSPTLRTHE